MPTHRSSAAAVVALLLFVGVCACGAFEEDAGLADSPTTPSTGAGGSDGGQPPASSAPNGNDAGSTPAAGTPAQQGNQPSPTTQDTSAEGALGLYVGKLLVTASDANFAAGSTLQPGADATQATARLSYHKGRLVVGGKMCLAATQVAGAPVTLASCTDGNALTWAFSNQGTLMYRVGSDSALSTLAWTGCATPSAGDANCKLTVTTWGAMQIDTKTRLDASANGVLFHLAASPNLCMTAQGSKVVTQACSITDTNQLWKGFASVSGGANGRGAPTQAGASACLTATPATGPQVGVADCGQAASYWYLMFGYLLSQNVASYPSGTLVLGVDATGRLPNVTLSASRTLDQAPWTIGPMPAG